MIAAINRHFPSFRVRGIAAGLHLMVELPSEIDESALVASALEHAIGVYGVRPYRLKKGTTGFDLGLWRFVRAADQQGNSISETPLEPVPA